LRIKKVLSDYLGGLDSMTTKVTMPQMGESILEGTITKWLKKVGERVSADEPLFEISTDKVDSEIPSPASGILSEILVPEGKTVQINAVLAVIDGAGAEEKVPALSHDAVIVSQETPERAPSTKQEPSPIESSKPASPPPALAAQGIHIQDIRTSPLVRKLARENDLNLAEIKGTGLEGRITKEDVLNFMAQRSTQLPATVRPEPEHESSAPAQSPVSDIKERAAAITLEIPRFIGEAETVPMTPMRKAIAERMVFSKRTSAHVNTVFEIDLSPIVRLRETHKVEFEKREGVSLTYTPFFAKALVDNVREFPIFNSSVSNEGIVYKKPINLGIAVALETGLIVPVIKDAHLKSFTGLTLSIHDLAERARTKRLKPEDVQNGTISMTNPGSFGALFATPIISQPQVAILGVGGVAKRPVVVDDAIAIRSMVYLSLTFDHRVIDGAVADQFMASLKTRLQSWTQWLD
jgi:pyruvate dehydrogenase E2 component (dihydrolipoamide acetyltransferase)